MHLALARELVTPATLAALPTSAGEAVERYPGYFYYGNVAPDARYLCGVPRDQTHFYSWVRTKRATTGIEALLATYTELAGSLARPGAARAFLLGYACHLVTDETWIEHVVIPHFRQGPLADVPERERIHLALYTHFDETEESNLGDRAELATLLTSAADLELIPFLEASVLANWRDQVVTALGVSGGPAALGAIWASLGRPPEDLDLFVAELPDLRARALAAVAAPATATYREDSLARSRELLRRL
ncbi:MAG: zinc dependent phospholipase C family protein [Chloroflexi bacterium]|nr:zinc dependent phospholipase C family protein [Chloroflexota bacterium]